MKEITILIVEDNLYDFESTNRKLHYLDLNAEIIHLTDGQQLIDYLLEKIIPETTEKYIRPDMILLDIMMPKLNGLEALKIINEEGTEEIKAIPIIMLTSFEDSPINKACFDYGVKGFLQKPIRLEYLKDFIVKFELDLIEE
jgi:two-component system response regulator